MSCATKFYLVSDKMGEISGVPGAGGSQSTIERIAYASAKDAVRAKWGEDAKVFYRQYPDSDLNYAIVWWSDGTFLTTPPQKCEEASLQLALGWYENGTFEDVIKGQGVENTSSFLVDKTAFYAAHPEITNAIGALELEKLNTFYSDLGYREDNEPTPISNIFRPISEIKETSVTQMEKSTNKMIAALLWMQVDSDPTSEMYILANQELRGAKNNYQYYYATHQECLRRESIINTAAAPSPWEIVPGKGLKKAVDDEFAHISNSRTAQDELDATANNFEYVRSGKIDMIERTVLTGNEDVYTYAPKLNEAQAKIHQLVRSIHQELDSAVALVHGISDLDEIEKQFPEETQAMIESLDRIFYNPQPRVRYPDTVKAIDAFESWVNAVSPDHSEKLSAAWSELGMDGEPWPNEEIKKIRANTN